MFNWASDKIEALEIASYMEELTGVLERIGAQSYAAIVKKYGEEMWRLYNVLENEEIDENEFYQVIEKANTEYHKLGDQLGKLLEIYFVNIHTELI